MYPIIYMNHCVYSEENDTIVTVSIWIKWLLLTPINLSTHTHTYIYIVYISHKNEFHGNPITHWSRVTHICINKLIIIGSNNGLSPVQHRAIIWTNAGLLLNGHTGTISSDISIEIHIFSFKKIHFKMSSGKWRPCWLGLSVLRRKLIN